MKCTAGGTMTVFRNLTPSSHFWPCGLGAKGGGRGNFDWTLVQIISHDSETTCTMRGSWSDERDYSWHFIIFGTKEKKKEKRKKGKREENVLWLRKSVYGKFVIIKCTVWFWLIVYCMILFYCFVLWSCPGLSVCLKIWQLWSLDWMVRRCECVVLQAIHIQRLDTHGLVAQSCSCAFSPSLIGQLMCSHLH